MEFTGVFHVVNFGQLVEELFKFFDAASSFDARVLADMLPSASMTTTIRSSFIDQHLLGTHLCVQALSLSKGGLDLVPRADGQPPLLVSS